MFYVDNGSGIPNMPDIAEKRADTPQWFSEGKGNQQITWPGADFFNMWQAEGLNILAAAGMKPDKTKLNQLALAIKALIKQPTDDITDWAKKQFLAKDQNGADIPDKQKFIENVGLTKTVKQAAGAVQKTGDTMTGKLTLPQTSAFGVNTDNALGGNSIVLGDNDTGFKQDGDGVLGIYANNARVGYIDNSGLHMSVDVLTNGGIRAGDGKRLSLTSNNNSTMTATFNLWGDANRPTVIELDDDQGWHLYSQRNPDGSIVFTVNGDITANILRAGEAIYQNNGDIFGSVWNGWLSTHLNNLVADVQLGAGTSVATWNNAGSWPNTPGYVVTSVWKDAQGENIDGINYAPLQKRVGNQWYTVQGGTV
ncbi:hypothetical protein OR045_000601 [Salmonella enterica]|nr:hypothetical protein [Salmonella enterica]